MPLTIAEYSFLQAPSDSIPDGRPSLPKGRVVRRQSAPAATLATFSRPPREVVRPKLIIAKDSLKVRIPSKASATTSVDVQNRTPSSSYSLATVTQRLRTVMQIFDSRNRSPLPSGQVPEVDEDQGQWAPLPTSPALEPRKPALSQATSSVHSFSRAPSFASLDAASVTSSEGPETPPPTHSPLHEAMSPTLAVIEHTSRMRVPGTCVTCKRAGSNFPSCSTCGDTWCSRECRVAVGGRKHHCHRRAVGASASDDVQVPYVTAA
ncbi:hypothetical protein BDW22DRAFT_1426451 [Trametopsis cervina]|nr:hypothetical protein BDW22DRAFT_1426451 [Trametopsis cervina]